MRVTLVDIPRVSPQRSCASIEDLHRKLRLYEHRALLAFFPYLVNEYAPLSYSEGILQLGTVLSNRGHEVSVINTDLMRESSSFKPSALEIADAVIETNPEVVGFGCKTPSYGLVAEVIRNLRHSQLQARVVFGGPHATACDAQCLHDCPEAIVIRNEADEILPAILSRWERYQGIEGILGVTCLSKGVIVQSPPSEHVDLATLPPINYSLLPGEVNLYHPYLSTMRGCPRRCAFCANSFLWGCKVRFFPISTAKLNLAWWSEHINGPRTLHIADPFININDEHCEKVASMVSDVDSQMVISADIAPDQISDRQFEAITNSPIRILCVGIETATENVRKRIGKKGSFQTVETMLLKIKEKVPDCFVKAYWILGLPGECKRSLHKNQKCIQRLLERRIVDMVNAKPFVPFPGSKVFSDATQFGIKIHSECRWDQFLREAPSLGYDIEAMPGDEIRKAWIATMDECVAWYSNRFDSEMNGKDVQEGWQPCRIL